jgi:glutamine synthetase
MKGSRKKQLMIDNLPQNLWQALEYTRASEFVKDVLGQHILSTFIRAKESDWNEFGAAVTNWEVKKYMDLY